MSTFYPHEDAKSQEKFVGVFSTAKKAAQEAHSPQLGKLFGEQQNSAGAKHSDRS
jgi:hypothetical protein